MLVEGGLDVGLGLDEINVVVEHLEDVVLSVDAECVTRGGEEPLTTFPGICGGRGPHEGNDLAALGAEHLRRPAGGLACLDVVGADIGAPRVLLAVRVDCDHDLAVPQQVFHLVGDAGRILLEDRNRDTQHVR